MNKRTGGDRLVRITNGTQYIAQVNTTFGIVRMGDEKEAIVYTLSDAVGIINTVNNFGVHKLYAKLVDAK